MNYDDLLLNVTPDVYARFKTAVELGKWPNGVKLTDDQKKTCMQTIIAWDNKFTPESERVGYIYNPKKEESNFEQFDKEITKSIDVHDLNRDDG